MQDPVNNLKNEQIYLFLSIFLTEVVCKKRANWKTENLCLSICLTECFSEEYTTLLIN